MLPGILLIPKAFLFAYMWQFAENISYLRSKLNFTEADTLTVIPSLQSVKSNLVANIHAIIHIKIVSP